MMFSRVFVAFPCGVLGQVWYLIVSIPDLCLLPYFNNEFFLFLFLSHVRCNPFHSDGLHVHIDTIRIELAILYFKGLP